MVETRLAQPRLDRALPRGTRLLASASVAGAGLVRMDAAQLADFRRHPGPIPEGWKPIAPTLLKAADEQTVAAVAAVLTAIGELGTPAPDEYVGWGAVAASRFVGRSQLVVALSRFATEGVWGVSPHLIPHFALHSPAGTLSLALGLRGPNLGIGGGVGSPIQGFLTALTWLDEGHLPGVWLVLSGHTPELIPGVRGEPTTDSRCEALALALVPDAPGRPRIAMVSSEGPHEDVRPSLASLKERLGPVARPPSIYRPHIGPRPASRVLAADPGMGLRLELDIDARARGDR